MVARRKSTPKVKDGRVQRKNRHEESGSIWNTRLEGALVRTERPGRGFRHVLLQRDVESFLDLLPARDEVLRGLNGIMLARGEPGVDGWYRDRVIGLCAWPRDLVVDWSSEHFDEHAVLIERLGVAHVVEGGSVRCEFTEKTARDYLLLHVLLHELGHHHDRMATRSQVAVARGEGYAETYAHEHGEQIWYSYARIFNAD